MTCQLRSGTIITTFTIFETTMDPVFEDCRSSGEAAFALDFEFDF